MCWRRPARRLELRIAESRIADQRARRGPLRHGVDDRHMAVAAGHDLELRLLALAAGRDAGRLGARCRLPVHPLQHFGERHAHRGRLLSGVACGQRRGEAGESGQAGGIRRLVAAQPQRLALGLAHHVQQAAQRQQRELADRPRRGVHLHRKRRDLDRRRAAGAREGRDRRRLLEQHGIGRLRAAWRERRGRRRTRDRALASASRC